MKSLSLLITYICLSSFLAAQGIDSKDSGKPIIKIFANYHHGISDDAIQETAFEVRRAYIGYQHNFDNHWKTAIKLDIGSPGDLSEYALLRRYAYFKNAYIQYTNKRWKIGAGLVGMLHIGYPEKIWGHRYVMKEFQDKHKLGSSADIGIFSQYHLNDLITLDIFMVNGEGYKNLQRDNIYKYGGGISLKPFTGSVARFHYDLTPKEIIQHSFSCILSYTIKDKMTIGAEGVYQINSHSQEDADIYGYSVFGLYHLNEKWELFIRYDKLASNILQGEPTPWNLAKDGTSIIGGIQYHPNSFLKFALNYQDWFSYAQNGPNKSYIYLNMEIAF
ncbi:MAG: hypothetical protein U9N86_10900 [Bacteroidota bacterium]|nr:hypothetical protein [Bacteroidota bacterium]